MNFRMILWIIGLSVLSGALGRMGGSGKPYKSWVRDWICPLIALVVLWLMKGFVLSYWWVYLIIYGFMGLFLTTYWDELFGFDNLWFSGFTVGLTMLPMIKTGIAWWVILLQAFVLAVIWGSLNKIKYDRILFWRRDVAEEFLRYASRILVLPILLI